MIVAILLTTFNRRQKTLACLESLRKQKLSAGVELRIFLTDDASSDGTADAVQFFYPEVNLLHGNGSLFWAGGMRKTWKAALSDDTDFYLLINDDTLLHPDALDILLKASLSKDSSEKPGICIGSTVDQETGKISYGGRVIQSKFRWKSELTFSEEGYRRCDFGHANIMLVSSKVVESIGILSEVYTHSLADYDYTLRARSAGFAICVAPGYLGTCQDDHGKNWKSSKVSLKERIQYLRSPKGLAYSEYLFFIRKHFPLSYPSAFCKLWLKTFFPFIWDTFKT